MKGWTYLIMILIIPMCFGIVRADVDLLGRTLAVDIWDGKCPICKEQNLKSKVYEKGCQSTLASCLGYFDEEGRYHSPGQCNTTTCNYECSNGHVFSRSSPSY